MNSGWWKGSLLLWLVAACLLGAPAAAKKRPDFETWLQAFRRQAQGEGISEATLHQALAGLKPMDQVIKLDRSQPETRLSLKDYLARLLSREIIARGRRLMVDQRALLRRIGRRYQVPPAILVALWGIESRYGRLQGRYPVIAATATLAYDGRRGALFRQELLCALRILDQGHVEVESLTGSWAGAMGQVQFMPSTFQRYGVDQDGDGRIDIWQSTSDALASAANYLHRSGWRIGERWGREVRLPKSLPRSRVGLKVRQPLSRWHALGVRRADGRALPRTPNLEASLVRPDGPGGRAFLVYHNYRVLLRWNRSHHFALSVGLLADRLN